jgi:hypothetical protein
VLGADISDNFSSKNTSGHSAVEAEFFSGLIVVATNKDDVNLMKWTLQMLPL